MPHYLFTFRPQISEQELFEQFLVIFLPILKKFPKWTYSIEDDQTLTKHIHAVFEHPTAKDKTAMEQLFNKKIFRDFKKSIKYKQTNDAGFDNQKIKEEDLMKVIGYVNKQDGCLRREYNFTNQYITDCVEYYYVSQHIDKTIIKQDLIIMTPRNIHIHIKDYCIKNNLEPTDPMTKLKMIKDGYCFDHKNAFNEIEINLHPERFTEATTESYDNMMYQKIQLNNQVYQLEQQIKQLKSHFHISQIETTFSGQVRIKGKGSDEEFKII